MSLLQGERLVLDIVAVGANHDVEVTWLADVVEVLVGELQQVGIDSKVDLTALAGFECDALEALEFLNRTCDASYHVTDVELHDFGALNSSRIGHSDRCGDIAASGHRVAAQREGAVSKGSVTQAIAEGEQRIVGDIQVVSGELGEPAGIGTARIQVVVIDGHLTHVAGHGDGEFAAGRHITEDHVTDGVSSLAATEPYIEDGGDVLHLPIHHRSASREIEQDDGLASGFERREQVLLSIKDGEFAA